MRIDIRGHLRAIRKNLCLNRIKSAMKHQLKTGIGFGLTSGIITTLGLMVGLHSGSRSKLLVIGGILTIAIADAFSDALGIHVVEESEGKHTHREIWESTIYTFLSKFIFALTFIVPLLIFQLSLAVIVSVIWGLSLLVLFNLYIASGQRVSKWKVVGEHLLITLVVIVITHYLGNWVHSRFG